MQLKTASVLIHGNSKVLGAIGHQTEGKFCGLGGKLEASDVSAGYGALRELLEELFNVRAASLPRLTLTTCLTLIGRGVVTHTYPTHAIFIVSLDRLERILKELKAARIRSTFYTQFPITIASLIKNRLPRPGEIIRLKLLDARPDPNTMTREFIHDLMLIQ